MLSITALLSIVCVVNTVDFDVHIPKAGNDVEQFVFDPRLRSFESVFEVTSSHSSNSFNSPKSAVPMVPFPRMLFMSGGSGPLLTTRPPLQNATVMINLPPPATTPKSKMARNLNFATRKFESNSPQEHQAIFTVLQQSTSRFAKLTPGKQQLESRKQEEATHQFVPPPTQPLTSATKNGKQKHPTMAHVSVPSHRLLNDILVIPSQRRFYILVIMPIHESLNQKGFECGRLDVNAFIRLAAFLDALQKVNEARVLSEGGLEIGAVIVDSCSSDLRTVANLYELLAGTNIERSDLIAVIRDDPSQLDNVNEFIRNLHLPVINTHFAIDQQNFETGILPSETDAISALLDLLLNSHSTCVSVIFDEQHASSAKLLPRLANERGICVEEQLQVRGKSSVELAQSAIRKLLLTEARVVIVLMDDRGWLDLMRALRHEMVITGRFLFATIQADRWLTSKDFLDAWPVFDQMLIAVTNRRPVDPFYLGQITQAFPGMPFPPKWLRDFWTAAFHCHLEDGEVPTSAEQFSRLCSPHQVLNITAVSPDHNIAPITLAVQAIAFGLRRLIDGVCPGALLHTINDCLSGPSNSLFIALKSVQFTHPLTDGVQFMVNGSTGFRDTSLVLNRIRIESGAVRLEPLAQWSAQFGLNASLPVELAMEERDGRRTRLQSQCPRSFCIGRVASKTLRGQPPTFGAGLNDVSTLIFAGLAALWTFVCLMCMYERLVSITRSDPYKACTMYHFAGLALLSLVSIFFMMTPSPATCGIRRVFLAFALAAVFAPVMVKTILIWRNDMLNSSALLLSNSMTDSSPIPALSSNCSPLAVFYICSGPVILQLVIVLEWAVFESPSQLMIVEFDEVAAWRCTPGYTFEQRLFHSMVLNVFMIVFSLVCSMLTVRNMDSRQNVLVCLLAIVAGLGLYLALPLLAFAVRDKVFAIVLLLIAVLNLLLSYAKLALRNRGTDGSAIVQENPCWTGTIGNEQLSEKEMQIAQDQGFWLNPHITMNQRQLKPITTHPFHSISEFVVPPPPSTTMTGGGRNMIRHDGSNYRPSILMSD